MPRRLLDISWMTSGMRASRRTIGAASPPLHHVLDAHQALAELSAGVQRREVLFAETLADRAASCASASPRASAAVVLAVGTRFIGQASSAMLQSRVTSAARASVDPADPSAR